MRDVSLMNPAFLRKEMHDLEMKLIPEGVGQAAEVQTRIDRAYDIFRSFDNADSYELTDGERTEIIHALAAAEVRLYNYTTWHEHALRSYRILLKDRRWIIASKLKFLAPK